MMECGKVDCAPVAESDYFIRCSKCGLCYGGFDKESTLARWNYQMQIERDNLFDDVATLQWEHDRKPFFVGNLHHGFWVRNGRKFETWEEACRVD